MGHTPFFFFCEIVNLVWTICLFLRYRAVFGETAEQEDIESEKIDGTKLESDNLELDLHADEEQNICKYRDLDHVSFLFSFFILCNWTASSIPLKM